MRIKNANRITPATVVRQEKQSNCMAGNNEMLGKAMFCISILETLIPANIGNDIPEALIRSSGSLNQEL